MNSIDDLMRFSLRGVRLSHENGKYAVEKREDKKPLLETENPLAAWAKFSEALDSTMRRLIGEYLEGIGRNRHTGELDQITFRGGSPHG